MQMFSKQTFILISTMILFILLSLFPLTMFTFHCLVFICTRFNYTKILSLTLSICWPKMQYQKWINFKIPIVQLSFMDWNRWNWLAYCRVIRYSEYEKTHSRSLSWFARSGRILLWYPILRHFSISIHFNPWNMY